METKVQLTDGNIITRNQLIATEAAGRRYSQAATNRATPEGKC